MARLHNNGSLIKRNDKWTLVYTLNGKRKWKSLKTANRLEAEERANEILSLLKSDEEEKFIRHIAEAKKVVVRRLLVEDSWQAYIDCPNRNNPSESTMVGYHAYFKRFARFCDVNEVQYLDELNPEIVEKYVGELLTNLKPQTYNKHKNFLNYFCEMLTQRAGLSHNFFHSHPIKLCED